MNSIFQLLIRLVLQLSLLIIGFLVIIALFVGALVLFSLWLVKALWYRITNRPIKPWSFNLNNGWQKMYRYRNYWQKNAYTNKSTTKQNSTKISESWQQDRDITDVEFKP